MTEDKVKGKAKEAQGALTDNESKRLEGKAQQERGEVKKDPTKKDEGVGKGPGLLPKL